MAAITALRSRLAGWLLRPHSLETSPVQLTQGRIYILPSRGGMLLGLTVLLMLLGCINYNLGLGYILTFLLAGVALVSLLHTFRNLAQLEIRAGRVEPVFAGTDAVFPLLIENPTPLARTALAMQPVDALAAAAPVSWCDPQPLGTARCDVHIVAHQRGRLRMPRVRVWTTFPLGLFYAWSYLDLDMSCIVYPAPEAGLVPLPSPRSGAGEGLQSGRGQDDFAGLRRYTAGDSLRHVAWKPVARGQPLMTKQFTGLEAGELWLRWADLPGELRLEARLSRITRWVVDAARQDVRYGLDLPGITVAPDRGVAHEEHCLTTLALYRG
jgi:uncharacterized protein (DUF58 family)